MDSGPATEVPDAQTLAFAFPLAVDEVKTVRFWVRLPEPPGALSLKAAVSAGEGSRTVSVTATTDLTVEPPPELTAIRAGLEDLVRAGHPDAVTLKRASGLLSKAIEGGDPALAIPKVIKATDALVGLSDPSIVELRVGLGLWLRWAALGEN